MEKQKESLTDMLNRLTGQSPVTRPVADVLEDVIVTRPSPGLHKVPAGCDMTPAQKALTTETVFTYLYCARLALEIFRFIVTSRERTDQEERLVEQLDLLRADLARDRIDADTINRFTDFRYKVSVSSAADRLKPEVRASLLKTMNGALDLCERLQPFIDTVAKYTLKLSGAVLGVERANDAAEDLQFAREIRDELSLMAME